MITSAYAGILGLLFFIISLETIKARRREKISLGAGENNQILHIVSAHSNFSSYTPYFLLLLYLVEVQGFNLFFLHAIGISFMIGRILHFLTMKNKEVNFRKRVLGMQLTLFPLIILSTINIWLFIREAILS